MSLYRHYLVYRKWNRKKWTLTITSSNSHCLRPQHWWQVQFLPIWENVTTDIGVYLALMPHRFNRVTNTIIQSDSVKAAQTTWLFLIIFLKTDVNSILRYGNHRTVVIIQNWVCFSQLCFLQANQSLEPFIFSLRIIFMFSDVPPESSGPCLSGWLTKVPF